MSKPLVVTDSTAIHHVQLAFLLSPTSSHSVIVKYRNQLWSAYYYIMCKMQFFNYIHVQLKSVSETVSANENESSKKCLRSAFFRNFFLVCFFGKAFPIFIYTRVLWTGTNCKRTVHELGVLSFFIFKTPTPTSYFLLRILLFIKGLGKV